jgi:hypothetical protein
LNRQRRARCTVDINHQFAHNNCKKFIILGTIIRRNKKVTKMLKGHRKVPEIDKGNLLEDKKGAFYE